MFNLNPVINSIICTDVVWNVGDKDDEHGNMNLYINTNDRVEVLLRAPWKGFGFVVPLYIIIPGDENKIQIGDVIIGQPIPSRPGEIDSIECTFDLYDSCIKVLIDGNTPEMRADYVAKNFHITPEIIYGVDESGYVDEATITGFILDDDKEVRLETLTNMFKGFEEVGFANFDLPFKDKIKVEVISPDVRFCRPINEESRSGDLGCFALVDETRKKAIQAIKKIIHHLNYDVLTTTVDVGPDREFDFGPYIKQEIQPLVEDLGIDIIGVTAGVEHDEFKMLFQCRDIPGEDGQFMMYGSFIVKPLNS